MPYDVGEDNRPSENCTIMGAAATVGTSQGRDYVRRILVAEDSSITQDLLKLVLTQRGYVVDIADDGEQALEALRHRSYHVALLDFHLPGMDGVQVVSSFDADAAGRRRPWFIAVTADVEGLLAHKENCESFDKIVPKPVDIQEICKAIDETGERSEEDVPSSSEPEQAPSGPPSAFVSAEPRRPEISPILSLDYRYLQWPDDFDSKHLSARTLQTTVEQDSFDAIVVREPATASDLMLIWQTRGLHLLPVIDLAGHLAAGADLDGSKLAHNETDRIAELVETFHDRRARLNRDLLLTEDLGEKLLGRIFMVNDGLKPVLDSSQLAAVSYNTVLDSHALINEAKKLVDRGFLNVTFFDRVHLCPGCGSSRFNVREECPECLSSNLSEESYLHHFRCAYQGPESDFRRNDDLICPKCRREVAHFGQDYDRPGTMITCVACGHATSEPAVGFVCLDCGDRTDGDRIHTRDIQAYDLTDQAIGFLEAGKAFLGFAQQTLRFSDLPLDLVVALNEEAKRYNDDGTPFALLDISYKNEREIDREHGARQFDQVRGLFIENLRTVLKKDVEGTGEARVVKGNAYDFALLKGMGPENVRDQLDMICERATAQLRLDLGVVISVFGAKDLS